MIGRATPRWPDRLASLTALRFAFWIAVATFTHQGILSDPFKVAEWMDDHQFYSWEESDRMTLLRFGQLPAWNPYWCGGTVGIAGPEDPFFGPDFLLRLVFGVGHGRRLAIVLLVVLGFEGMYRLCRRLDSSVVGAAFAAVVYGTCDRFVTYIRDGWVNFMGFELIPLVLYFLVVGTLGPADDGFELSAVERRERMRRARLLGGFFVAWIVLSAGTYPTPYSMLSVGYVAAALSVVGFFRGENPAPEGESAWKRLLVAPWLVPWICAATIGLVALGLSAGKMFPTLSFLRQFPRVFTPVEVHSASSMFTGFWTRYFAVVVLAFVGVVTADLAAGIFAGGALFFFALAMGDFGESAPFHVLKTLPIFGQLRFPDRFMVGVLLFASVAASRGITRVEDALPAAARRAWTLTFDWWSRLGLGGKGKRAAPPFPRELAWLFVGVAAFVAYSRVARPYATEILTGVRIRPGAMYVQEGPRRYDGPFRQSRGNRRDVHLFTAANMGSIYCVSGNPIPESALLRGDLEAEEYPEDPTKATVKRLVWTPNEITLEVDAKEPATVLVNQNWAPEWRSNVGTVRSYEKLLSVDVPAGKHVVVLAYKDRFLTACLFISLLSLIGVAYVLGRDGVRWFLRERARWSTLPFWPVERLAPSGAPVVAASEVSAGLPPVASDVAVSEAPAVAAATPSKDVPGVVASEALDDPTASPDEPKANAPEEKPASDETEEDP